MIVQTSRSVRRLVARLERGESVLGAIASAARTHEVMAAMVQGTGVVTDVSITPFDPERGAYGAPRALRGPVQLVALNGSVAWEGGAPGAKLSIVVARESDRGLELVGGRLEAATALAVELVLDCWDDVAIERVVDGATGLDVWSIEGGASAHAPTAHAPAKLSAPAGGAAPTTFGTPTVIAPGSAPAAGSPRTLAEAAKALEGMPERPPPPDLGPSQPEPERGDLLEHPSFGIVEVEDQADLGRLRIRLPSGSRREILLEVFDVIAREPRDGRRVWSLRPRRR